MKRLIAIVLAASVLSSACLWTKRFEGVVPEKLVSDGRIELRASLNDTLFRIQDLSNYCEDSVSAHLLDRSSPMLSEELSVFKGPKVTFVLVNHSTEDLRIPFENLRISNGYYDFWWPDIRVALDPVKPRSLERGHPASLECSGRKTEDFEVIAPGDSSFFSRPLDVFLYNYKLWDRSRAGNYSVRIIYTSRCWIKGEPEIWIGQAQSEWMEFRVVAD